MDPYYTQKRFFLKNQDLSRFYYNPVFAQCWELTAAFGNAVVITENPSPDSSKKIAMVLIFFNMQFWLKKKNFYFYLFIDFFKIIRIIVYFISMFACVSFPWTTIPIFCDLFLNIHALGKLNGIGIILLQILLGLLNVL